MRLGRFFAKHIAHLRYRNKKKYRRFSLLHPEEARSLSRFIRRGCCTLLGRLTSSAEVVFVVTEVATTTTSATSTSLACLPIVSFTLLELSWLPLWCSHSLLEVFILELHSFLHIKQGLHLGFQSCNDLCFIC